MVPVSLSMLWLPILLSAVFVFIASNILWMMLPFWHYRDYRKLPDETSVLDALANVKSGQYSVPLIDWKSMTPEAREAFQRGPSAYMLVRNPARFSLGKALTLYFLQAVVVAVFIAYLTGHTRSAGSGYLEVFRVAGTAGFLAYGLRGISDGIWFGKPWIVVLKEMIDGLIYALLMAGTFGWLWPR
jgi:hypothetical protein